MSKLTNRISQCVSKKNWHKMAFVFAIAFFGIFGFFDTPALQTTHQNQPIISAFSVQPVYAENEDEDAEEEKKDAEEKDKESATGGDLDFNDKAITFILQLLTLIYSTVAWAIGKLITIVIGLIIIPILGYNNFADSNIIDIGWPLVRDVVNMFIIILLIVIAIKTMLGLKGTGVQEAQQQILRVFFAVIAVNFSRSICVFFIDFGQVVMFTFVNAIKDIAAGNFVQLFQLNSAMAIDSTTIYNQVQETGTAMSAFGYLGSAYAIVALLAMVLAVLIILAVVFVYRIVILWVLVILSPLAFFLWGAKDVLPQAAGRQKEWWNKFTGAVMLGPMMAFFLWLGLAAASNGSIAAAERFESPAASDTGEFGSGLYNEIFQVDKLLSLMIGIIIIAAGFQASSSAAAGMGGIAAKLITEQKGMGLLKKAVAAPARYPYLAGRAGVKAAGTVAGVGAAGLVGAGGMALKGSKAAASLGLRGAKATGAGAVGLAKEIGTQAEARGWVDTKAGAKGLAASAGRMQRRGGVLGIAARPLGSVMGAAAGRMEAGAKRRMDESRKMAAEDYRGRSKSQQIATDMSWFGDRDPSKAPLTMQQRRLAEHSAYEVLTDEKRQEDILKQLEADYKRANPKAKAPQVASEARKIFEEGKRRMLGNLDGVLGDFKGDDANFDRKKNALQTRDMHLVGQNIREKMKGKSEQEITDAISAKYDEIISSDDHNVRNLSPEAYADPLVREAYERRTYRPQEDWRERISMRDRIESGQGVSADLQRAIRGETKGAKNADFSVSSSYDISGAFRREDFDLSKLSEEAVDGTNQTNIADGIADAVARGRSIGAPADEAISKKLNEIYNELIGKAQSAEQRRKYRMAQAVVTGDNASLGLGKGKGGALDGKPNGTFTTKQAPIELRKAIQTDISIVGNLTPDIEAGFRGGLENEPVARVVADSVREQDFRTLEARHLDAYDRGDEEALKSIRQTVENLKTALDVQFEALEREGKSRGKVRSLMNSADRALRNMPELESSGSGSSSTT